MIRVMSVVARASWERTRPGAMAWTIHGAARIPIRQIAETTTRRKLTTRFASRIASAGPLSRSARVRVGTKAAHRPSAKRSRRRFGTRKATWKASTA